MGQAMLAIPIGAEDHLLDAASARVTVVLYSDYMNPQCCDIYTDLLQMRQALGDVLRLVVRHFPLPGIGAQALRAAEAAEAAAAQGKFWELHDRLCGYRGRLDDAEILTCALEIGLDTQCFLRDLASHRYATRIRADFWGGLQSGVQQPPAIFINGVGQVAPYDYGVYFNMIKSAHDASHKTIMQPDRTTLEA